MGFDASVRYAELTSGAYSGAKLRALLEAAETIRVWRSLRYTDLREALADFARTWPKARLTVLIEGDDEFREVLLAAKGTVGPLRSRLQRLLVWIGDDEEDAFVGRAEAQGSRAFYVPDPRAVRARLVQELQSASPVRREAIYEELADDGTLESCAQIVAAVATESDDVFFTLRYLCSRDVMLPLAFAEFQKAWACDPKSRTSGRLLDIVERKTAAQLGVSRTSLDPELSRVIQLRE
ncbi:MAG: hypothetical protein AAGE52_15385 [Myxococcota bacterium]